MKEKGQEKLFVASVNYFIKEKTRKNKENLSEEHMYKELDCLCGFNNKYYKSKSQVLF